jgi:clan AA aspartic protease
MIAGVVNPSLEATVEVEVVDLGGQRQQIEALVDTGFGGFLGLPPAVIASLGLAWLGRDEGTLGDGSVELFDVYHAILMWDGQPRTVEVYGLDSVPLLGMASLAGHEVMMQVIDGGNVTITALP